MIPRLGVNIDHFATLRQARGTPYPDIAEVAKRVEAAGADQITVHLREDRRHIQDNDVTALSKCLSIPLNLEMAVTPEMVRFASRIKPTWVCFVPEKRKELTTEGGLDVKKQFRRIEKAVETLRKKQIKISIFIEPSKAAVRLSSELGANAIELHTGKFAELTQRRKVNRAQVNSQLSKITEAGLLGQELGLSVHAGHGLDDQNVRQLIEISDAQGSELIQEYNIGHWIVCRAAIVGIDRAIHEMLSSLQAP